MKLRIDNYTFDASEKTITFNDYTDIKLSGILYISNNKNGVSVPIFDTDTTGLGGTVSTNVLTLAFDTSSMSDFDPLFILYEESAGQKTANKSQSVVIASDQSDLVIVGEESSVSLELTRPADTNAYIAKDAVSDSTSAPAVLTFSNLSRANGKGGYIVKAQLMTDQKTCTARFRLHLYDTAPAAINDNAAFGLLYANAATRLGYIDFPACSTEDSTASTGAMSLRDDLRLKYLPTGSSRTIYGLLETLDTFTPASGQKIHIRLSVDNN